eukprot:672012-Prymnesium_polylepis.1
MNLRCLPRALVAGRGRNTTISWVSANVSAQQQSCASLRATHVLWLFVTLSIACSGALNDPRASGYHYAHLGEMRSEMC